jgi:predicted anti-sigma-YlaC factor YlaD
MKMECDQFQELVTDYLEGSISPRLRVECASHRLVCRECRELYDEVRATVRTLNNLGMERRLPSPDLPRRILTATTAGEMLGCGEFDQLLAEYFDGVILAPTYHTFQHHFLVCEKCRRLMSGVEEAIALCQEIRGTEIEVPESLPERIVAVTVGEESESRGWQGWARLAAFSHGRVAAAILILAASSLLILSRYGSLAGMANHASLQADLLVSDGQERLSRTGDVARGKFEQMSKEMNTLLVNVDEEEAARPRPTRRSKDATPGESE